MANSADTTTLHGRISVPYRWTVGETGSHFLTTLRDEGRLEGTKCETCKSVFVPPRKWCPTCFIDCTEWVPVSLEGEVVAWTVVRKQTDLHPHPVPFAYATIRLDGATGGMLNIVLGDVDAVRGGTRVRAVLRDERIGDMSDITHFEVVQ